ncbi:hypothetical protein [Streptomyces caniscabiei]|uniref:hypothetical protein n=1 Tax=Streptomyces caniscabiei TaxID=2746961 RepID=UPI0038F5D44A
MRRIQLIGFPTGLAGAALYTHATLHWTGTPGEAYALAADVLTAPALRAATLLGLLHGRHGHRLTGALAPASRMALSSCRPAAPVPARHPGPQYVRTGPRSGLKRFRGGQRLAKVGGQLGVVAPAGVQARACRSTPAAGWPGSRRAIRAAA